MLKTIPTATYIGKLSKFKNKKAMLILVSKNKVKAQWGDLSLGTYYTHNWTLWNKSDFENGQHDTLNALPS